MKILTLILLCVVSLGLTGCATLACGLAGVGDAISSAYGHQQTNHLQECLDQVNGR